MVARLRKATNERMSPSPTRSLFGRPPYPTPRLLSTELYRFLLLTNPIWMRPGWLCVSVFIHARGVVVLAAPRTVGDHSAIAGVSSVHGRRAAGM